MPMRSTGCTNPTACNYDANPTTDTDNSLVPDPHRVRQLLRGEPTARERSWTTTRTTMASAMQDEVHGLHRLHGLQLRRHLHHRHRQHLCVFKVDAATPALGKPMVLARS